MNLTFLGTCSGTEPMPGRRHTAYVVEHGGGLYWIDAGEGCSHTAHVAGLDLLAVRAIFISHPHMDHVGGLANLLWTMQKLDGRNRDPGRGLAGKTIPAFIPNLDVWNGVLQVLGGPTGAFRPDFTLDVCRYSDGRIYRDTDLCVTALHNLHLGEPVPGHPWQSFSFRIEAGGRSLVTSGDVGHVRELAPLLDGCDLFLMETGHHRVDEVCGWLRDSGLAFGRLGFFHHGRAVLSDPEGELRKARAILGDRVFIADDGLSLEV